MKVLDLFSGIGGFSLGLERAGHETVAFCEINPFCREILKKHWPNVPIFEDVRTIDYVGAVDIICGGFPCQDISVAGKRAGLAGSESGLWFEFKRLIERYKPKYAIIENVGALRQRGLVDVLKGLAEVGYDAEWHLIPASYVGSPQLRDRCWIVAYPMQSGQEGRRAGWLGRRLGSAKKAAEHGGARDDVENDKFWPEPSLARVANGLPRTVDRINALGNAVVPQIPEMIGANL